MVSQRGPIRTGDQVSLWELIAAVLGVDQSDISDSTSAADLPAWDSLAQLSLVSAVEENYAITMTSAEMRVASSVVALRSILAARGIDS